jgi:hypothetical protein
MKLTKAQAQAIRELVKAEQALAGGRWDHVRDAAIRLANLAAERAAK